MRIYVTARHKGLENKDDIEQLCEAVSASGMEDFCFIRDVEHYQKVFDDPKDLWERAYREIKGCDALLIDVSDVPTGGRVVEAGIAYGLDMPVFVIAKRGTTYKPLYDGISTDVILYDRCADITPRLTAYLAHP